MFVLEYRVSELTGWQFVEDSEDLELLKKLKKATTDRLGRETKKLRIIQIRG